MYASPGWRVGRLSASFGSRRSDSRNSCRSLVHLQYKCHFSIVNPTSQGKFLQHFLYFQWKSPKADHRSFVSFSNILPTRDRLSHDCVPRYVLFNRKTNLLLRVHARWRLHQTLALATQSYNHTINLSETSLESRAVVRIAHVVATWSENGGEMKAKWRKMNRKWRESHHVVRLRIVQHGHNPVSVEMQQRSQLCDWLAFTAITPLSDNRSACNKCCNKLVNWMWSDHS